MTSKGEGERIDVADLEAELRRIGHELGERDIVLVYTGRDRFVEEPGYMALGPAVTAEATLWLYERGVRVMGIETWGWDGPRHLQAQEALERDEPGIFWAAHQADIPYSQIERLAHLGALAWLRLRCAARARWRADACPLRAPPASHSADRPRRAEDAAGRDQRDDGRDLGRDGQRRERDTGSRPDHEHDGVQDQPAWEAENGPDHAWQCEHDERTAGHPEDSGRHRGGHERDDEQVDGGRDEGQPADRHQRGGEGRTRRRGRHTEPPGKPAGDPAAAEAADPA